MMFAQLVSDRKLTTEELKRMRRLLDERMSDERPKKKGEK
jgi:hypothetical protein